MRIGKLTNEELKDIVLSRLPKLSERTLIGANIGADCAWLDLGDKLLVTSSDPITAGGMQSGALSIHVSCNDIAACGIRPSAILTVLIAPPDCTKEDVIHIVEQASSTAKALGVDIVGGHTEVSDSVNRFIVITTAFGIADKNAPVPRGIAKPGDSLIMTKTAGIEGTWIAAMEHEDALVGKVSEELLSEAKTFIDKISVVEDGVTACSLPDKNGEVSPRGITYSSTHLMHDVTEGGVLGAAYEMADFSGIGVSVDLSKVPVAPCTKAICEAMDIDPYRLISSGSILVATDDPEGTIKAMEEKGVPACVIGAFTEKEFTLTDVDGKEIEFLPPQTDELYKM